MLKNITLLFILTVLTACGGAKHALRVKDKAPNEYYVTTQKPLELPDDFYIKRPDAIAIKPQKNSIIDILQSQNVLPSKALQNQNALSLGESILVQRK